MKILNFLKEHGTLIILLMVLIIFFRTCGMNTKSNRHDNYVKITLTEIDSLINTKMIDIDYSIKEGIIERQIEGLKNEKRMIQATDRKMADYERQNVIENEIKLLEEELNNLRNER